MVGEPQTCAPKATLSFTASGTCHAIVLWIDWKLAEGISLSWGPKDDTVDHCKQVSPHHGIKSAAIKHLTFLLLGLSSFRLSTFLTRGLLSTRTPVYTLMSHILIAPAASSSGLSESLRLLRVNNLRYLSQTQSYQNEAKRPSPLVNRRLRQCSQPCSMVVSVPGARIMAGT
eukprot:765226-Hanusia_phi.AAC.1